MLRQARTGIWVGIVLGFLAVFVGEVAAHAGVPSPSRTNVLFAVIGLAALYRGGPTGLVVAGIAWLYQLVSLALPGLPFAYTDEGRLRLFMTALAMPAVALVLGAFHDTLEHVRRSEPAQREIAETLGAIVSAAPAAVITADVAGRVKLWNPAAEQMFGWTSAEVVGRPAPIVPDDRAAEDLAVHEGAFAGNPARDLRTVRVAKDGRPLDVSLSIAAIRDASGRRTGTVLTLVDITDEKRRETQRVGAQRAELLGQLTAGVAHDFANILAAVSGYGSLVSETLPVGHEAQPDLAAIDQAAVRGIALTRQLLAYGRQQPQALRPVNIGDVVAGVLPMLQQLVGAQCLLSYRRTTGLGLVHADPGQIEQVIANLVINARDAMPTGGTVTIATANVERDEAYAQAHLGSVCGPCVSLSVADDGGGIDESIQERIFQPYFTTKEQGTGLGLATVYGIVKQSGGYIGVTSSPGQGATFTVDLPRTDVAGLAKTPALVAAAATSSAVAPTPL